MVAISAYFIIIALILNYKQETSSFLKHLETNANFIYVKNLSINLERNDHSHEKYDTK